MDRSTALGGIRDMIAGTLLAYLSLRLGRTAALHPEDPLAWLFDLLALGGVVWGLLRALRHGGRYQRLAAGAVAALFVLVVVVGVGVAIGRG